MFSVINSSTTYGIEAMKVKVETDITRGIPSFTIVGLAGTAIKESRERVKSAIINSGYNFPMKRIVVNLSPADIRKDGSIFDLPVALSILFNEYISRNSDTDIDFSKTCFVGELSLDGQVKYTKGVLSAVCDMRNCGMERIFIPEANAGECIMIDKIEIIPVKTISECIEIITGKSKSRFDLIKKSITKGGVLKSCTGEETFEPICADERIEKDFSDIKGNYFAKRCAAICVSGGHNMLMIGPPGSGKSMIADRIPGIMGDLSLDEQIEVTKIYSVAGMVDENTGLITKRPFRNPHHTITKSSMCGGGINPVPGEISLANKGVLFLDELPEFNPSLLETLRQPLENNFVNISRLKGVYRYPANFILICAMNPCRCGYYMSENRCKCRRSEIDRYLGRISGPMLDRIDIILEVSPVDIGSLHEKSIEQTSSEIRSHLLQVEDFRKEYRREILKNSLYENGEKHPEDFSDFEKSLCRYNSKLGEKEVELYCRVDSKASEMLDFLYEKYKLSGRMYYKIIKLARTIADYDFRKIIEENDILEAFAMRKSFFKYFRRK